MTEKTWIVQISAASIAGGYEWEAYSCAPAAFARAADVYATFQSYFYDLCVSVIEVEA